MALFNSIILGLAGNPGVAAYGLVANLALVATAMLTGVAQGIQPLISRAYGAGDCAAILQARRIAMVTALIFGALFTALAQVFPAQLTALFNAGQDAALGNLATLGMRLYSVSYTHLDVYKRQILPFMRLYTLSPATSIIPAPGRPLF